MMERYMEPRANKRTQQTRERILAAAQKLFLQQGYLATSTDAVLAEAGIASKETLYRYYASKEELFTAVLERMSQPEYLALLRITMAEAPRFPQLGPLFVSTVPQRGLALVTTLLQEARARKIITDIDLEAVARTLLGGLLTYAITNLAF